MFQAAKYDDYFKGTDLVLELPTNNPTTKDLLLSIDVGVGTEQLDKKWNIIKEAIGNPGERLPSIKYFQSEHNDDKEISVAFKTGQKIPKIILSITKETLNEFSKEWKTAYGQFGTEGLKYKLGTHYFRGMILREALIQAEAFSRYAGRLKNDIAFRAYSDLAEHLKRIISETNETLLAITTEEKTQRHPEYFKVQDDYGDIDASFSKITSLASALDAAYVPNI